LGMTGQRRDGCFQRVLAPGDVPGLPGLDHPASDRHGTHGDLACGHGHRRQEVRQRGQQALACRGGHGRPNQPRDAGRIVGVKRVPIGVRLPGFQPSCHVPAPLVGTREPVEGRALRGERGHQGATRLGPAVPAEE
jgi:hypothetical protein